MKKFVMAIVCLMTMVLCVSCGTTYHVSAEYEVCWPDGTMSYSFEKTYSNSTEPTISCYSIGGTNYLSLHSALDELSKNPKGRIIESTTAPIRLVSSNVYKVKKGKPYVEDIYLNK